jgi:methyl-accepting chemotaxis protein
MSVESVLRVLLYVLLIALSGYAIWGVREVVSTARSVRKLSDDMSEKLPPLIERADATLVSVNAEISRVNGVVSQFEEVSNRVSHTARAAQEIAEAPVAAVSGLAEGARKFFSTLFRS